MTCSRLVGRLLAATALSFALFATSAHADNAGDLETARMLLHEGNDLRAKGDLRAALAKYVAAHAIVYTPITGLEVGRTHLLLGELVEAREALLAVGRIPVKAQESQNATAARIEADRLANELEPRIPTLRLVIEGLPPSATPTLVLDGQTLPIASVGEPRKLNPGKHHVVAKAEGMKEASTDTTLAEGESRSVTLKLEPAMATTSSTTTSTTSSSESASRVDRPTGTTSSTPPLVYVGFGIAAAGVVVGGVTGVLALSKGSTLKDACPDAHCGPSQQDALHDARALGTVSTISFVVAGAGATLGVIGLLTKPSATPPPTTGVSARLTVGLGTIGLVGSFR
jgi:hypothetical protein